jgi:uncharacterized protein YggT (Ycf19 family)
MTKFLIISYLVTTLEILRNLLLLAILLRSLSSFFVSPYSQRGRIVQFLYDVTDPFVALARLLPHRFSMIDFSTLIAMIMVDVGGRVLIILLSKLA